MFRRRIPVVKQHDITDCGAACLASVAEHYGYRLPISRIRQFASTDRKGTSLFGLVEAARRMGFSAKGVRATREGLKSVPKPAIAHVLHNGALDHYVVVYEAGPERARIMDPYYGAVREVSYAELNWTGVLLVLTPGAEFRTGNERGSPPARFWALVRPHRTVLTQALFGAVVYTLLGLSMAIYVQKIVDHVMVGGNTNLLNLLSVVMLVLLVAQVYIGSMKDLITLRTGQRIDAELILGYYKHLLKLPQQFFDTMRVGEIISRVNDAVKIRAFINDVSLDLTVNLMVVVFSVGLMFVYSWKLALLVLVLIPLYGIIYYITNRVNRTNQRHMMERAAELESQLVESITAVSTIKRFGLEWHANARTESHFVRLLRTVYRSGGNAIFAGSSSDFVSRLVTIALLWVGTGFVLSRSLTPGELMSCYALIGYLTTPLASLVGMNRTVQDALIAADRLFEILDLEREREDAQVRLTREAVGDIRFADVSFRYGTRAPVFERLTLRFPRGVVTAVVGESGSGKSTLASLVQNLYPIEAGRIYIGDHDLRYISNESLRELVGVVPQKLDLFAGTFVDNIAVGEYQPDMERVIEISRELGILEFIEESPNGFRTHLGENGATLSGGQKQRVAIARALYRDPEILILDEATSALDSASEQHVQRTVRALRERGKTVIIIAHRLSTVVQADKIVVLERGQAVEEGTHAELMERRGHYHRLWREQFPFVEEMEKLQLPAVRVAAAG